MTVLDPATKLQTRVPVETGLVGGGNTEIISGLDEGATVVLPQVQVTTNAANAGRAGTGGLAGGLAGGGGFAPPGGAFGGGGRG